MSQNFAQALASWYSHNGRKLPWRSTTDPYKIWISEVVLQQTRVDQGMAYYLAFTSHYPNVESLAAASEDDIMALWKGLGYYNRAKNLLEGAKQIVNGFKGQFPNDYHSLLTVKGIGDYTAGAIASIAFNEAVPAVDGNVLRVISRIAAIDIPIDTVLGKRLVRERVLELIDVKMPGIFNQSLMELGAVVCKPRNPDCNFCPVHVYCTAFKMNGTHLFPKKDGRRAPKKRFFIYFLPLFYHDGEKSTLVQKRGENDIWRNLYELPLLELQDDPGFELPEISHILKENFSNREVHIQQISPVIKHQLTHQTIFARFIHLNFNGIPVWVGSGTQRIVSLVQIQRLGIPRLIDKYLEGIDL